MSNMPDLTATATAIRAAEPLLTIIVPTFNRAENLKFLLEVLQAECASMEGQVQVLVSDNASTDGTREVVSRMRERWPSLMVRRHLENVGPDENFCSALDIVRTRYFWIIGDDDCPRAGLVVSLLELLRSVGPAIVYLESEWMNPLTSAAQRQEVGHLQMEFMDLEAFTRRINVWFTFISACVIDRTVMLRELGGHEIRRFTGTSLVQLGWVYPVLKAGKGLVYVRDRCVLATKDNTGGYKLLTVFGINLARITRDVFGLESRTARSIIGQTITRCLPGLVWGVRRSRHVRHLDETPWQGMRRELGGYGGFWLVLVPLGKFPKWLAFPVFQCWRLWNRLSAEFRKLSERKAAPRRMNAARSRGNVV